MSFKAIGTIPACLAVMWSCSIATAAELVIPGSGNPEYVLGVLAANFNTRQREHRVSVPTSTGSAGAIRDVLAGSAVLGRIGRPLNDDERAKGLTYVPIGRDAVVFVAGAGVSARSVTTAQMIDAYTGKITNWRGFSARPGPIRAIGREIGDSSRQAVAGRIPAFRDMTFAPGVKMVHLDPQMLDLMDRYDTSLGMLNRSALYAAKTKLVPLTLDAVEPTPENVASGRYPIWVEFGLIHKEGAALPAEARAFMSYLKSAEGVRILRAHNVVSAGRG